jgi:hypothetical protein
MQIPLYFWHTRKWSIWHDGCSQNATNKIQDKKPLAYMERNLGTAKNVAAVSVLRNMRRLEMNQFKHALVACMLTTALLPTVTAHAATYYVAMTGNNTNPGTSALPWRTVAYAVNTMVAGDTTYVMDGTYNEGLIWFKRSGTQAAPIKLLNYPGDSPIIHCIDPAQQHRINFANASGHWLPIGWITVEGFEIRNCKVGFRYFNLHDSTFRRNWIHDNQSQGIVGGGTRILIDRNVINHNGHFAKCAINRPTCNQDHGIYGNGTAWTVTNNLIYDNLAYGIQLNGTARYDSANHSGPEFALSANWIIANNTMAYNANRAGIVVWGSSCQNIRIENNIFHENSVNLTASDVQGIDFASMTSTGITIKNNLAFASGSGGMKFLGPGANEWVHYTQSGNLVNKDNPRFVNAPATLPALPNFALTEGSPAIDKGLPLAMTKVAFDGTTRPQGRAYDIGAYEYSAGDDAQSPSRPDLKNSE